MVLSKDPHLLVTAQPGRIGSTFHCLQPAPALLNSQAMEKISVVLDRFLRTREKQSELELVRLWRNWPSVLGPELSRLARPLGRRKSALVIGTDDSIVMQELSFCSTQILDNVERFLGWQPFDKVTLELLKGRTPLDQVGPPQRDPDQGPIEDLPDVGGQEDWFAGQSALQSCYRAYVRMVQALKQGRS